MIGKFGVESLKQSARSQCKSFSYSDIELDKKQFVSQDASKDNRSVHGSLLETYRSDAPSDLTSKDITQMLSGFNHKFTKQDMYFRNQERLMRNFAIPEHERMKAAKKMRFQAHHCTHLSMPKIRSQKMSLTQPSLDMMEVKSSSKPKM